MIIPHPRERSRQTGTPVPPSREAWRVKPAQTPIRRLRGHRWVSAILTGLGVLVLVSCGDGDGRESVASMPEMLGLIEGFYGTPYSFEQRLDLLGFLPEAGLDTYIYAPKDDSYHRAAWRDPYPAEYIEHFRRLAETGKGIGVRFVFALSPGLSFDPDNGDPALVREKLSSIFAAGVRDFCLFFDDIAGGSPGADPDVQADLVTEVYGFLQARDPATTLCFISNYYCGTADEMRTDSSPFAGMFAIPSSAYYRAYRRIPPQVSIMWTGPRVFSDRLTVRDTEDFRAYVGRPVLIWDNYPVNDGVLTREMFLGPYQGRESGLASVAGGVLLNTMTQPQASKLALFTAGRSFARGDAYDPAAALDDAVEAVSQGGGAAPLRTFVDHFQSHPLIGDSDESPRLARLAGAFFETRSQQAEASLRGLFQEFATNRDDLKEKLGNPALLDELREPAEKLALLGEAGLLALDLLDRARQGKSTDVQPLRDRLAEAELIPWRVGANTIIPGTLDLFLAGRKAKRADVFGDFFERVFAAGGT